MAVPFAFRIRYAWFSKDEELICLESPLQEGHEVKGAQKCHWLSRNTTISDGERLLVWPDTISIARHNVRNSGQRIRFNDSPKSMMNKCFRHWINHMHSANDTKMILNKLGTSRSLKCRRAKPCGMRTGHRKQHESKIETVGSKSGCIRGRVSDFFPSPCSTGQSTYESVLHGCPLRISRPQFRSTKSHHILSQRSKLCPFWPGNSAPDPIGPVFCLCSNRYVPSRPKVLAVRFSPVEHRNSPSFFTVLIHCSNCFCWYTSKRVKPSKIYSAKGAQEGIMSQRGCSLRRAPECDVMSGGSFDGGGEGEREGVREPSKSGMMMYAKSVFD